MRAVGAALNMAILGMLSACSQQAETPIPAASAGPASLYAGNCAPCHQQDGRGIAEVYPPLAGSAVVLGDPAQLARWVLHGQRAAAMPAGRYRGAMPQFGWLKDADAASLFSWLRTQFGNRAPAVDAATVRRALNPAAARNTQTGL